MKALVQDKYNLRYFIPLCLFLLISVLFLSSGALFQAVKPVVTTPLGRSLSSEESQDKVVFERSEFYQKSHLLVTSFYIQSASVLPTGELKVEVFEGKKGKKIEGQLEKINDNYYVLFTPNVSPKFKQIINSLSLVSDEKQSQKFGAIAVTPKNVTVKNEVYQTKNAHYFETQYKDYARQNIQMQRKANEKNIQAYRQKIKNFNANNQELLLAMKYKTGDQQKEIQQKIDENNSAIEGVNLQIQEVEKANAQLKEQEALLKEK